MSNIDFDAVLEQLEIATERPAAEIKAEIEALMDKEDYHLPGAIAVWKSENQGAFATEKARYTARVIVFEPSRTANTSGGASLVSNVHFAYENPETAEVEFKIGSVWGKDRIDELAGVFDEDKVYTFEASQNARENLTRIGPVKERDDDGKVTADLGFIEEDNGAAPTVDAIEPMPILSLADKIGEYEIVRGYVGDIIYNKGTKVAVGFQLSDATSLRPLRVWFAGKYTKMTPAAIQSVKDQLRKAAEVIGYGYVNQSGLDMSLNASAIWFVG